MLQSCAAAPRLNSRRLPCHCSDDSKKLKAQIVVELFTDVVGGRVVRLRRGDDGCERGSVGAEMKDDLIDRLGGWG